MAQKKAATQKAGEFHMTVILTPEGIRAAYDQLADAKSRLQAAARRDLAALTERIGSRSTYTSDEEAEADIEEARNEVYQQRHR